MTKSTLIQEVESEYLKKEVPEFGPGDTISVTFRIVEGNKERHQVFTGTVIARKGTGLSETITLHRVAYGMGMERLFLLHSPQVAKIKRIREGRVRRAKLNYLKGTTGKAAKVPEKITTKKKAKTTEAKAPKAAAETQDQNTESKE